MLSGGRVGSTSRPRWFEGRDVAVPQSRVPPACHVVVISVLLLPGCTLLRGPKKDRTEFFSLEPAATASTERPVAAPTLLRTVEVPAHLQRSRAFAVRQADGAIHYLDLAWWSEPLDLAFSRVLREDLDRLGMPTTNRRDQPFTHELTVHIERAEGVLLADGKGRVEFTASFELRRGDGGPNAVVRRTFTAEPAAWDGKDHAALARALSKAAADLAAQIRNAAPRG
jgi:uncharacterized lipoprotein YmbA